MTSARIVGVGCRLYLDGRALDRKGTPMEAQCEADDEILIDAKLSKD